VVTDADTAVAHHSGDVPVLSTPRVLALAEEASMLAVADRIGDGLTSVGVQAEVSHVKATHVGAKVRVRAQLIEQVGNNLSLEFTLREGDETVAYGTHRRAIVDRERFLG